MTENFGFLSNLGKIFLFEFTKIEDRAVGTIGILGFATVATVQQDPVVGFFFEVFGYDLDEFFFHVKRRLAGGKAGSVADTEDVRIHGDGRLTEGDI